MNHQRTKGELLYGRQPIIECLRAKRRTMYELHILSTAKPSSMLDEILAEVRKKKIPMKQCNRRQLDDLTSDANHQGVVLRVSEYPYLSLTDLINFLRKREDDSLVLILDHIEDPQNVGSLLRAADAAGVDAVVLPAKRAAGITPATVKASAGAAEHVKVCLATSFIDCIKTLKKEGLRLAGLEADNSETYTQTDLTGPLALIVGSEGKGMSQKVRENCDTLLKIPMSGKVSSLNAAQAGVITLFEMQRQRNSK